MLELRPNCECCNKDLLPDSEAYICTFECTFCRNCTDEMLKYVCPNCSGNLSQRPINTWPVASQYSVEWIFSAFKAQRRARSLSYVTLVQQELERRRLEKGTVHNMRKQWVRYLRPDHHLLKHPASNKRVFRESGCK